MKPPIDIWLDEINLYSIDYKDFPIEKQNNYYFLEKLNGELDAVIYKRDLACYIITRNDVIRKDLYVLDEYKKILDKHKGIDEIIIMGEGIAVKEGKILPFNQSQSILKTAYKNKENNSMYYHYPFDIFSINNKRGESWSHHIKILNMMFKGAERIHPVKYIKGDISKAWNIFPEETGVEGLVARNGKNYKIKKSFTFDMVIIAVGAEEMISWNRNEIGYIKVAFMNKDENFIITSKVGTGLSKELRSSLYKWASENEVERKNKEIWVKPSKIVEIKWRDIYIKDMPILKYTLNGYIEVGKQKSCTLFQPSLVKFREDKKVRYQDLRIEQIPGYKY